MPLNHRTLVLPVLIFIVSGKVECVNSQPKITLPYANRRDSGQGSINYPGNLALSGSSNYVPGLPSSEYGASQPMVIQYGAPPSMSYGAHSQPAPPLSPAYGVSQDKPKPIKKKFHIASLLGLVLMTLGVAWILVRIAYFSFAGIPEHIHLRRSMISNSTRIPSSDWDLSEMTGRILNLISTYQEKSESNLERKRDL